MNARTFQKHHKNQKRQGNADRRSQAKREIDQALDSRAFDFAEDARKINSLYTRFAAESNADAFAEAVLDYANASSQLVSYIPQLRKIVEGHQAEAPQNEGTVKNIYDYEQKRLEAMNREFQRLLRKIS